MAVGCFGEGSLGRLNVVVEDVFGDSVEQRSAVGETAVQGRDAHAGAACNRIQRRFATDCEHEFDGGVEKALAVSLRVSSHVLSVRSVDTTLNFRSYGYGVDPFAQTEYNTPLRDELGVSGPIGRFRWVSQRSERSTVTPPTPGSLDVPILNPLTFSASSQPELSVVGFSDINRFSVSLAGGKGAQLGELSRIDGISVPPGFIVTTDAYRSVVPVAASIGHLLDHLSLTHIDDRQSIGALSAELRRSIEQVTVPDALKDMITGAIAELGDDGAYAIRSSATAEDSPSASFAGQHDTYLNVVGVPVVIEHVKRCWASLFSERAVTYRMRNGFAHHKLEMAVVVQQMVAAEAAGVLFTVDPVTCNRKVSSVEATFGLGESLVSGHVNPDRYHVRDDTIVSRSITGKKVAVAASASDGTQQVEIEAARQHQPALSDAQVVRLVELGRRIEAHFDSPQDIEWCLADGGFQIVQSRPIARLFPIPAASDEANHVYVSVGHQQMMTDAMKPLGLSVWQLTTPKPMAEAGGRLFVDFARLLASPATRAGFLALTAKSDPLLGDALRTIVDRGNFLPSPPDEVPGAAPGAGVLAGEPPAPIDTDPVIVTELIEQSETFIALLKREIAGKSGPDLFDFILADIGELKNRLFDPRSHQLIMASMEATWWLNDKLEAWLGEKNAADTLAQSGAHNVTSEMGLALLDVADAIRPHPKVVAFLEHADHDHFLDQLANVEGGSEVRNIIGAFLDRYGMRCVGEIDITRPRWIERPATVVPMILGNLKAFEPGAGARRFEQGRQEASAKEHELIRRLRDLPDGDHKAAEAKRMIDRVRTFSGYREYPKYAMVSRYFLYKQALLKEAERLVQAGILREIDDIFFLRFDELHTAVSTEQVDEQLIVERRDAFKLYENLIPPRVLTSDGEVVAGSYRRDNVPADALVGLAVSAGTIEGRARVLLDIENANLEPGDILVTTYTDPSWTPLFLSITGLVTEVGGLMTHGSVIAREYGVPAVVGVQNATRLIQDGQRIRVNGTDGYIEILPSPGRPETSQAGS